MKIQSYFSPMTKGVIIAIIIALASVISASNSLFSMFTIPLLLIIFLKVNFKTSNTKKYKFGVSLFGFDFGGKWKKADSNKFLLIEPFSSGGRTMANIAMESNYSKLSIALQLDDKKQRSKKLISTGDLKELREYAYFISKELEIPLRDKLKR